METATAIKQYDALPNSDKQVPTNP